MIPDPIAWAQLPPDAQRILATAQANCACIDLWFNDDGSPALPAEQIGERLGLLLIQHTNVADALACATELTARLVRKGCNCLPEPKGPVKPSGLTRERLFADLFKRMRRKRRS